MKINLSELIESIKMTDEETRYVIDESNGQLLMIWGTTIDGEFNPKQMADIEKGDGYLPLPLIAQIDAKASKLQLAGVSDMDAICEKIGREWAAETNVEIIEDFETDPIEGEHSLCVTIGANVSIGAGVKLYPGVQIGDNVTIEAGSVVTKNVPAGTNVSGTY